MMKKLILSLLLIVGITAGVTLSAQNNDRRAYNREKQELLKRIDEIRADYMMRLRSRERIEADKKFNEIVNMINDLVPDVHYDRPEPMRRDEFESLLNAINKAPFSSDKKKIIMSAGDHNFFLCDQVIQLASKLSFDNDKLEMVEALYPKVLDRDKSYTLFNCFTFSTSKDKLQNFIKQFDNDHHDDNFRDNDRGDDRRDDHHDGPDRNNQPGGRH